MIFDVLNGFLANIVTYIHTLYSVLPQSPLVMPSGIVSDLATPIGYVSWFLPMSAMLAFLALYVVAVSSWAIIVVVVHLVEQVTP